jgi:hypothetical protein
MCPPSRAAVPEGRSSWSRGRTVAEWKPVKGRTGGAAGTAKWTVGGPGSACDPAGWTVGATVWTVFPTGWTVEFAGSTVHPAGSAARFSGLAAETGRLAPLPPGWVEGYAPPGVSAPCRERRDEVQRVRAAPAVDRRAVAGRSRADPGGLSGQAPGARNDVAPLGRESRRRGENHENDADLPDSLFRRVRINDRSKVTGNEALHIARAVVPRSEQGHMPRVLRDVRLVRGRVLNDLGKAASRRPDGAVPARELPARIAVRGRVTLAQRQNVTAWGGSSRPHSTSASTRSGLCASR